MIAVVTDSSSQIQPKIAAKHNIAVVPIPVTIDGDLYHEGVNLDPDTFYEHFADRTPKVTTSQPSPGEFGSIYRRLQELGASEIVSVHVTESMSGTLNSARLGAESVDIPVHLVDARTTSYGVSIVALEVATKLANGETATEAAALGARLAEEIRSVFILPALEYVRKGGRVSKEISFAQDVPVLVTDGPAMAQVGSAASAPELCALVAAQMHADGRPIKVALGTADAPEFTAGIEALLADRQDVVEIVHYRVGPSVGAHTGPGTAGGFWTLA